MRIYDVVRDALVERGWEIHAGAIERPDGEVREFVHPVTGKKMAWINALLAEQEREVLRANAARLEALAQDPEALDRLAERVARAEKPGG
jgi:hypothetical protein